MLSNPHVIYLSAFIYVDANATGHNSLWSCLLRLDLSEVFFMMVMVVDEGYSNWYDSGSWLLLECWKVCSDLTIVTKKRKQKRKEANVDGQ